MSYQEYLKAIGGIDCRQNWIEWKMIIGGMTETEAIKAAYNAEWGYQPLPKR